MGEKPRLSARGMFDAAAFVCVLVFSLGILGRFFWMFDNFSSFQLQYLIAYLVFTAIYLFQRRKRPVLIFAALFLLTAFRIIPFYAGGMAVDQAPVDGQVRLMLCNVNRDNTEYDAVLGMIAEYDPDVVILEEVTRDWIEGLASLGEVYDTRFSSPRDDCFGMAMFSKLSVKDKQLVWLSDAEVPSIRAVLEVGTNQVVVLGTHPLPPADAVYAGHRNRQLQSIAELVNESAGNIIVLGDLNCTPWSYYFKKLVRQSGLKNAMLGQGLQPTWPNLSWVFRVPLDHCLYRGDVAVRKWQTAAGVGSDHRPVIVDVLVGGSVYER